MEIQGKAGKLYISDVHAKNPKGSVVLAHGICHGAWCWDKMQDYLALHGFDSYALSYRGHKGSDGFDKLKNWTISDYTDDVRSAIEHISQVTGEKPFLLGHSMGGAVVQKYIGLYEDTVCGAILFASATAPKMPFWKTLISTCIHKDLFIAWCKSTGWSVNISKMSKSAFFNGGEVTRETIEKYSSLLQKESSKVVNGLLKKEYSENYNVHIPVFVIGSASDSYFKEDSLNKTADMYKVEPVILKGICHDMMLDERMPEVADHVIRFMEKVGL